MTARYAVILTPDAAADLEEIHEYIATHDAPAKADHVLGKIEEAVMGLERLPQRGAPVKELAALGVRDHRETYFKPYRIVYQVIAQQVEVYLIADGRRDMATLLEKRLLRP
ncbi:type II toxin-antitoxin system RelE/ParE family toxin [Ramlibacter albus]|uniref:Type II toxin-antitoxin system RelE/ParE family toxin n=1 Tax=Ramlibacter albus TaxID=2079448 RepID=A0A923MF00_9BURK|nr:type II toxin-antitoxin system RelE/ParE family toxin [Ramlibacter albus]MBC5767792.1 type II toxin-antitoxin system RelE/ParE family toxin [Ramlibacter albus]